ncbi:MAG: Na(+)-translocating NADH-quinone reductase subunit A [Candidatus Omnitrophica bacterium]|nr:Na(+)-translocating NADH-quinone reductase subunit A [Candidatus Omnitrophota bacterium]
MEFITVKKGKNIPLKGKADKRIEELPLPDRIAIKPPDFKGLRLRVLAKADDLVKVGTPILEDKKNNDIKIVSPASGKVVAINRGLKRALLEVVIETDGRQNKEELPVLPSEDVNALTRDDIIKQLLAGGVWPCIRQRPFSKIADPYDTPKSIFINAMSTDPLAIDIDFVLREREEEFQTGLNIIKKLTGGDIFLCCKSHAGSKAVTEAKGVKVYGFSGPHPTGNASTHIHYLDPIQKGELVWYIQAEDVIRIAALFLYNIFSSERFVAITGEGATKRIYKKTNLGAPVTHLLEGDIKEGMRYISGSVFFGTNVGVNGFLSFYDSQITVIPEGGSRKFLGWLMPGFNKYTVSKTFASAFDMLEEVSLNADEHGGHRAIVLNDIYDDFVTLDIMTYFLIKAVIAEDIDEAERLGILECDEEDFALCTFACPSKTDVGGIIRKGLDIIEKEG